MLESPKADLHRYLQAARDALLWKLDGRSEYDVRRPMVPTGTNLLGLVKHVASVELGYFGDTFCRAHDEPLRWFEPGQDALASIASRSRTAYRWWYHSSFRGAGSADLGACALSDSSATVEL